MSCATESDNYGLQYKILGLDQKWTGGDMSKGPGGGMKLNLLKQELKDYESDTIILFSDSYDVIFLSGEEEIMDKYLSFKTDLLFAGEKVCWPDKSMEYLFTEDSPYRYINSGGFIGKVSIIKELLDVDFQDSFDDQYFIHSRYLEYKNHIKIDLKCEIFQTSCPDFSDIEIIYPKNRLKNKIYNTYSCHYHGNGGMNIKIKYNNYCNYLLKQWNPTYQCCLEKKDINDKLIYIFKQQKLDMGKKMYNYFIFSSGTTLIIINDSISECKFIITLNSPTDLISLTG